MCTSLCAHEPKAMAVYHFVNVLPDVSVARVKRPKHNYYEIFKYFIISAFQQYRTVYTVYTDTQKIMCTVIYRYYAIYSILIYCML